MRRGNTTDPFHPGPRFPLSQILQATQGTTTKHYVYGIELLYEQAGIARTWYAGGGLGSVRQTLSDSGGAGTGVSWPITSWSGSAAGWGEKSAALTVPQVRQLLQMVLPRTALDAETAIALINYIQDQNYDASRSHQR